MSLGGGVSAALNAAVDSATAEVNRNTVSRLLKNWQIKGITIILYCSCGFLCYIIIHTIYHSCNMHSDGSDSRSTGCHNYSGIHPHMALDVGTLRSIGLAIQQNTASS